MTESQKAISEITENSKKYHGINNPDHYSFSHIEPWDVWEAWDLDPFTAAAVKYICRKGKKKNNTEIQDLIKAIDCLQRRVNYLKTTTK